MQITADGRIAIPPEMQQQLGLEPGAEVHLEIVGNALHLTKKNAAHHQNTALKQAFGFLPQRIDPRQFQAQVRDEWQPQSYDATTVCLWQTLSSPLVP